MNLNCFLLMISKYHLLASIKELTGTKICVTSKGIIEHFQCIWCNYTGKFQNQTVFGTRRLHYIGLPVEPEMKYFIHAYSLPPANINEDSLTKSILLTTPVCKDNVTKYNKSCIEMLKCNIYILGVIFIKIEI
uniref:Uncharacterized protein n=1 Tax=Apteryx owenii TaxID=8824 RepID=A0A8B9PNE6_APTOW